MKRLLPFALAALPLLAGVMAGIAVNRNPHEFAERCEECHLVAPQPGQKGIFVHDIDYLCLKCHQLARKNSHPSELVPSMKLPGSFPVDWQGRITCTTCHDPHAENLTANPAMLRGNAGGRDFCTLCHQNLFTDPGKHLAASEIAHTKSWTSPDRDTLSRILDKVSLECLACHEGSVGPVVTFQTAGQATLSFQGRNFSHPIGMDYAEAASGNRELRSMDDLSPMISLYEGKVGCTSCHSPFSKEADMLVFSNRGSALCLECHLK
jgi:predicted CXXCH cytochrome family protein